MSAEATESAPTGKVACVTSDKETIEVDIDVLRLSHFSTPCARTWTCSERVGTRRQFVQKPTMATPQSRAPLDPLPTNGTAPLQQKANEEVPNGAAATKGEALELPKEQPSKEAQMKDMDDNYKAGRSFYLTDNYEAAADRLSYATQLGVKLYGEFAPECFNSHLYYGKTLVELSRQDSLAQVLKPPSVQDEASDSDCDEEETENVVRKRLEYLKSELESGTLDDDNAKKTKAELEDVHAVNESIMAEIADARDSVEEDKKMKELMREESERLKHSGQGTLAGGSGGGEQTVDVLTAFVRKRKQPGTSEQQNNENGISEKSNEGGPGTISETEESGDKKKARLDEENAAP